MHLEPPVYGAPLLEALFRLPAATPAVVLLRHSVRGPVTDLRTAPDVLLTTEGEVAARRFGEGLPPWPGLRLWHSPIRRCGQTAEAIAGGALRRGLTARVEGADPTLGVPYLEDLERLIEASRRYDPAAFVRAWFDGRLEPGIVQPADRAARDLALHLLARLDATPPGELSLLASHDWNVMLLRERLLGVRHEEAGWLDYLDGLVLAREAGGPVLRWRERSRALAGGAAWS